MDLAVRVFRQSGVGSQELRQALRVSGGRGEALDEVLVSADSGRGIGNFDQDLIAFDLDNLFVLRLQKDFDVAGGVGHDRKVALIFVESIHRDRHLPGSRLQGTGVDDAICIRGEGDIGLNACRVVQYDLGPRNRLFVVRVLHHDLESPKYISVGDGSDGEEPDRKRSVAAPSIE